MLTFARHILKIARSIPILALCIHLPELHAQSVKTYASNVADFSKYKTYEWMPGRSFTSKGFTDSPPIQDMIWKVLEEQLTARGLVRAAHPADMKVTFLAVQGTKLQVESIGGWPEIRAYIGYVQSYGRYIPEGTLGLNFIDGPTGKSAWVALCTDTVKDPNDLEPKVRKAVDKAFKKFPIPKK